MDETWKEVVNFNKYKISNFGNLISYQKCPEGKIIKGTCSKNTKGYVYVTLHNDDGIQLSTRIHILVWDHFSEYKRKINIDQIDHIDGNKKNNNITNLQLLTNRQNTSKYQLSKITSSKYTGVCFCKANKKWISNIYINKKHIHLGYFDNEYDAHLAYEKKLKEINV